MDKRICTCKPLQQGKQACFVSGRIERRKRRIRLRVIVSSLEIRRRPTLVTLAHPSSPIRGGNTCTFTKEEIWHDPHWSRKRAPTKGIYRWFREAPSANRIKRDFQSILLIFSTCSRVLDCKLYMYLRGWIIKNPQKKLLLFLTSKASLFTQRMTYLDTLQRWMDEGSWWAGDLLLKSRARVLPYLLHSLARYLRIQ